MPQPVKRACGVDIDFDPGVVNGADQNPPARRAEDAASALITREPG